MSVAQPDAFIAALYKKLAAKNTCPTSDLRRPFTTLTYAQSIDGSVSAHKDAPLLLSGSESMTMTHHLRAMHQCICVGVGTVIADNPSLTVRLVPGSHPRPVIIDSSLRSPLKRKLFGKDRTQSHTSTPIVCCTRESIDLQELANALVDIATKEKKRKQSDGSPDGDKSSSSSSSSSSSGSGSGSAISLSSLSDQPLISPNITVLSLRKDSPHLLTLHYNNNTANSSILEYIYFIADADPDSNSLHQDHSKSQGKRTKLLRLISLLRAGTEVLLCEGISSEKKNDNNTQHINPHSTQNNQNHVSNNDDGGSNKTGDAISESISKVTIRKKVDLHDMMNKLATHFHVRSMMVEGGASIMQSLLHTCSSEISGTSDNEHSSKDKSDDKDLGHADSQCRNCDGSGNDRNDNDNDNGSLSVVHEAQRGGLVNQLIVTIAPMLIGGVRSVSSLLSPHNQHFPRLHNPIYSLYGQDIVLSGEFR